MEAAVVNDCSIVEQEIGAWIDRSDTGGGSR